MGELSRIAYQVRHYRELARIATDCAGKNAAHRAEYLELAKQWTTLADRLDSGEPDNGRTRSSNVQNSEAEGGPVGR